MQKKIASQLGIFNIRVVLAVALFSLGASLGWLSFASTPSSETLTDVSGPLTYTAGPFNFSNATPVAEVDTGPRCSGAANSASTLPFPCDSNALTVNIPAAYLAANPNASVKVTLFWTDAGSGQSDYDLYIYNGVVGSTSGAQPAQYKSSSSSNPEIAVIFPVAAGAQQYTIKIVPFTSSGEIVNVRIELQPGVAGVVITPGPCDGTVFGGPDKTCAGNPRYQNFFAPAGSSAESSQGEFNIGFDRLTNRIMVMNIGPIWRLTPGEVQVPAKPECCEALWEDKSSNVTNTGLDPILWTDKVSGRTFASNTTAGTLGSIYTDAAAPFNDGDQWVAVAGLPNGGADHQTIGSGPFPASLAALAKLANQGQYVLYCSQNAVGAFCQRSLDLGASFDATQTATGNGLGTQGCGGLHGHVHIAPDGTAWLPDKSCTGAQGGAFSLDASTTPWTEFVVKKTVADTNGPAFTASVQTSGGDDPSIGLDSASTAYYCYVNNEAGGTEGHAHVAVGKRTGSTINWIRDVDVGATHGIVNAAHTEAVGGSAGRAACGFMGTNVSGNYQSGTFKGVWYAYIATTYDEGVTWVTVNATPNDPVQNMTGIWQQGGSGENGDRNLLDFNEITVDNNGRTLYGYSDGCHSPACIAGTPGDRGAFMRVARQFGGKSLFASFDTPEPALPKPPCLSGTRDPLASHLTWKAPDNGGSDIVSYEIWRSTTSGTEVLIATTGNAKTTYNDTTADPAVPLYFYYVKAINAQGTGPQSNEISLSVVLPPPPETTCVLPGLTILTDPSGDLITPTGVTTNAGWDLRRLSIAEPYAFAPDKLVFTLKVESFPGGVPPENTRWPIQFVINGGNTAGYWVDMSTFPTDSGSSAAPVFKYGTFNPTGGTGGVYGAPNTRVGNADPSSTFSSDGTIRIVVPRSAVGNPAVGANLTGFLIRVRFGSDTASVTPDNMPSDLAPAGSYTVVSNSTCFPLPPGIVSRKVHGSAGLFDIDLPTSGNPGIECRSGGSSNAYTLIYTFGTNLGFAGAAIVTQGSANVASTTLGPNPNQVTVQLINVTNAQHLVVTLASVRDSANVALANQVARMDVLLGDTTANGLVNSSDIAQTQSQSGQPVTSSNFREDVTVTGSINSSDISLVQSKSGTGLPAAAPASQPASKSKPGTRTGRSTQ